MARGSNKQRAGNAGVFFMATLVMWAVSVVFEITFNKRDELLLVFAGLFFFQLANWVIRFLLDMLNYRLYAGWFPSILAHHLILLICFTLALYRNVTVNYLILTLICELHSVFLHVRKVRRMAGIRTAESKIVKAEWVLNWLTFFFARLIPHLLILIKLLKDASRFGKGIELPLALFGMIGMNLLNIGLGLDLFSAFTREINPPQDHRSD